MNGETDSDREIRAMVLLSLPYPPLPVHVARVESGYGRIDDSDEHTTTSHDLIARALAECAWRNDELANAQRRERQEHVFEDFMEVMTAQGFGTREPEVLYLIYCRFTLAQIATYLPPGHPVDIRFRPYACIARGDRAHRKLAEYMAAQAVLFEDPFPISRAEYVQNYDFGGLLFALRDRLARTVVKLSGPPPEGGEEAPTE